MTQRSTTREIGATPSESLLGSSSIGCSSSGNETEAHSENGEQPGRAADLPIRTNYKGNLLRYRDPAARVAQTSARRRERLAVDEEYRARLRAQSAANKDRVAAQARRKVRTAISQGVLVRPDVCEHCGKEAFIEGAHHDYSQPLSVHWLCRSCHRRWDKDEPKANHGLTYVPTVLVGEQTSGAKLTTAQVLEIRRRVGTCGLRALGREFGVSHNTIREIRDRKTWRHLA